MTIPPTGANGWYTPQSSEYINAFTINPRKISIEYYTYTNVLLDVHMRTDDLKPFLLNNVKMKEEKDDQVCFACGESSDYEIKLKKDRIRSIHPRCYKPAVLAIKELFEEHSEVVVMTML